MMLINKIVQVLLVLIIPLYLFAQSEKYTEYDVKAAYLEKFTRFIEWPAQVHIEDKNKPFVIGVVGEKSFISILNEMYSHLKIKGKKVEILDVSTFDEIARCNLLFISQSEKGRINQILSYTENKSILTISDDVISPEKGIMITLFVEDNHIYFEINKNALERSGLYVSTLLLNLSKTINTEEN